MGSTLSNTPTPKTSNTGSYHKMIGLVECILLVITSKLCKFNPIGTLIIIHADFLIAPAAL